MAAGLEGAGPVKKVRTKLRIGLKTNCDGAMVAVVWYRGLLLGEEGKEEERKKKGTGKQ